MSIEIHTITFGGDLRLLELQALSVDRYFDHSEISKYRIIVNDPNEIELSSRIYDFFNDNISFALRNKLEIEKSSTYIKTGDDGWKDQQYLKLYSVKDSLAEWVMVLDSKNHFVKDTRASDFFSDGLAKTYFVEPPKSQQPWLRRSLEFFDVKNHTGPAMPTVTPYIMKPRLVGLMLSAIRNDPRTSGFENMFSSPALEMASEFFLYFAFLTKLGSVPDYYCNAPRLCETLYTVWPQDRRIVERYLKSLINGDFHVFGLHRKRLPQLSDKEKDLVRQLWSPMRTPQSHDYYLEFVN